MIKFLILIIVISLSAHLDENQHGEYFVYPNKSDLDLDKNDFLLVRFG